MEWNEILDVVTLVVVAAAAYGARLLKMGTEAAVTRSAELAAEAADRQRQWQVELTRELQKVRGVERQELRYQSYGALWNRLRPLAIYDETVINKKVVGDLSSELSNWYFSARGGLLLTPQARSFYFALQDLLRTTSRLPQDWVADRSVESEGAQRANFITLVKSRPSDEAMKTISVLEYFKTGSFGEWQTGAPELGRQWRDGIRVLAEGWMELDSRQRFAILQQAGSILRSSLVNDLESRLG